MEKEKIWTVDIKDFGQKETIKNMKLEGIIECLFGDVAKTVPELMKKEGMGDNFQMVFVDDGHSYDEATRDLEIAYSFLDKYGYILVHDAVAVTEVAEAIDAFLTRHQNEFEKLTIASVDGLCILKKI